MRAEQYQRQLDAVTDYIYAHLDDDLSLDRLADVSGFSRATGSAPQALSVRPTWLAPPARSLRKRPGVRS